MSDSRGRGGFSSMSCQTADSMGRFRRVFHWGVGGGGVGGGWDSVSVVCQTADPRGRFRRVLWRWGQGGWCICNYPQSTQQKLIRLNGYNS